MRLVNKLRTVAFAGLAALVIGCGDDWSKVPVADAGKDQPVGFDKSCVDSKSYNSYGNCKSGYKIKNNIHPNQTVTLDGSKSHNSQYINSSNGGLSYNWNQISGPNVNLSDPHTANPTFTPSSAGDYVFGLLVNNDDYKSDIATTTVYVRDDIPPFIDLNYVLDCSDNKTVYFSASGSYDVDGTIKNYEWDFGDGVKMSSAYYSDILHTYNGKGNYNVNLSVTDNDNTKSQVLKTIQIGTQTFSDDTESGTSKWVADPSWVLTTSYYHSPTHSWCGSDTGSLTSISFSTLGRTSLGIALWERYFLYNYDYNRIEVSADSGTTWTEVKTYNNGNSYGWMCDYINIDSFINKSSVMIRFRFDPAAAGGRYWCVDDVVVE